MHSTRRVGSRHVSLDTHFSSLSLFPSYEKALGDLARVGQVTHEVHFSTHRLHESHIEADDAEGIVRQLHVQHVQVEIDVLETEELEARI